MMRPLLVLVLLAPTFANAQVRARRVDPQIDRYFQLARAEFSGERAKETVAIMAGKQRWPGNTAFDAALDRVVAQLRAAGYVQQDSAPSSALLTYRIETRPLNRNAWDMIDASITVVGDPRPLMSSAVNFNMLATNSASTPDTGVVAEVIDIGKGADYDRAAVAGKIVLVNGPASRTYAEAVQRYNAVGVLAYSLPMLNRPDKNRDIVGFTSISDTGKRAWAITIHFGPASNAGRSESGRSRTREVSHQESARSSRK